MSKTSFMCSKNDLKEYTNSQFYSAGFRCVITSTRFTSPCRVLVGDTNSWNLKRQSFTSLYVILCHLCVFQPLKQRGCLRFSPSWWPSAPALCAWCLPSAGRLRRCVPTPTLALSWWQDRRSTPPLCCCSPWPRQVTPLQCSKYVKKKKKKNTSFCPYFHVSLY